MTRLNRCTPLISAWTTGAALSLGALSLPPALAQTPTAGQLLNQQRLQLQQLSRQQQVLLQDQLRCLDRAGSLQDLERCRSIMPAIGPHGMGGWRCPMW